jgi:hypothetical protein
MMTIGSIASAVGRGLLAGAIGTAAMTLSSTLEMKLRGRAASSAPADAVSKVLGVEPVDEAAAARFSTLVHWGYGTAWGAVRGFLAGIGLGGCSATAVHFAAIWGGSLVMLPALDVAPPVTEMAPAEVAIDAGHHLVYVVATALAYRALTD